MANAQKSKTVGQSLTDEAEQVYQCREARGTLRIVGYQSGHIIKEYIRRNWPGDLRRPWVREHKALTRLEKCGVRAPRSFGYRRNGRKVGYHREFVPGSKIEKLADETLEACVAHLAEIHLCAVTVCDPSRDNLIMAPSGRVLFIDYGRARTFKFRTPLFFFYVGKELVRMYRETLHEDDELWHKAIAAYERHTDYRWWSRRLIDFSINYWFRRWRDRIGISRAG
jgi:tRNA A-37 threonylcarbamoyl transferase component Bud32